MKLRVTGDGDLERDVPADDAPRGKKIGVVDEYGSIWSGEPGAPGSTVIGDLVPRADEETFDLHLLG